jgi:hypothetical protein
VRLRFTDGGETVIRPESSLQVQDYYFNQEEPQQDSLVLRLLKGGLRAVTGYVGKRGNQDAYKMQISTATIGIRGTDYSARLCAQDCKENAPSGQPNTTLSVAARVVAVAGQATVTRSADKVVALTTSTPIYSGDVVETGPNAYAVLVFRDNARITVNPNSRFALSRYSYDPTPKAEPASMLVEMLKGGLRFATGLIGKNNPTMVKVRTVTATVGIRGTVFDLVCAPGVSDDTGSEAALGDMPCDQSLFAQTREGTIALASEQGEPILISANQQGRVDGKGTAARALSAAPAYFRNLTTPEPESVQANIDQLFGVSTPPAAEGVFLTVNEGRVQLSQAQQDVTLDAGESAFAGQSLAPVRLFSAPASLNRDPFLSNTMFNANMCRR